MEENRLYESPQEGYSLCLWVRERLPDLQEGYLDAMTAEAVRAHLSVCFLCMKEYNEMEQTVKLVEGLPFVDPQKDHSPAIMAALEEQSGYSFQAPVVEMETETLVSKPRTTTGHQRLDISLNGHGHLNHADSGERIGLRDRVIAAVVLLTCLASLLFSPWGRSALGTLGDGGSSSLAAVNHVPLLGPVCNLLSSTITLAGQGAARLYEGLSGPNALAILAYLGVSAGVLYWRAARTERRVLA